jgi:RHH-type transcriptional regulator, proline utilization regulon repressor / proline dehydrogenase / delta 1-pyrroline-5-carboxylate dehydrogenase
MVNFMTFESLDALETLTFADEGRLVSELCQDAELTPAVRTETEKLAAEHVKLIRARRSKSGSLDAFLQEYSLSSDEGVVLMCLAEALLRIPDAETADKLIADKLPGRDWEKHFSKDNSLLINASAWSLMLSGRILGTGQAGKLQSTLQRVVHRAGEPIIRNAMKQAMRIMAKQFVFGRTIEEACGNSQSGGAASYRYSFDMLGESAMTMKDADRYHAAYRSAIDEIAKLPQGRDVFANASLSVKLSALHPRYEVKASARVMSEVFERVLELAQQAKRKNIGLTIDAEEQHRLILSLRLFDKLASHPSIKDWNGLGLAVQAYGKRALPALKWLKDLAQRTGRCFPVRLVKGAYWDTEIKKSQESGYSGYPVFTRKAATDASYLACAKYMIANSAAIYPQFATHNAHTVAALTVLARDAVGFEFQRLHGMGQELYDSLVGSGANALPCRVYAPVGSHEDLLSYLVRRLLENGANTSFVNRLADDDMPIDDIIADPVEMAQRHAMEAPGIELPTKLFAGRANSRGTALWLDGERGTFERAFEGFAKAPKKVGSIVSGREVLSGASRPVTAPHDNRVVLGTCFDADAQTITSALNAADAAQESWNERGAAKRAAILEKAADLFERNQEQLISALVLEAGKTLDNAQGELREAVDFLRYYAIAGRKLMEQPLALPGPTGEENEMVLHGKGVFACISPWNFPLAIFSGQIAAALMTGNSVIAKAAEQTPIVASLAVKLMHEAGVPSDVLHLLLGDGASIGKTLLAAPELCGVAFTGSNETAVIINRALAQREGPLATLIAETGGINAMIIDSSALPEQAVRDLVSSAFDSAGQRCSAARVAFVQKDIFGKVEAMLAGSMRELAVGNPAVFATDVGPVIDQEAMDRLLDHTQKMRKSARVIAETPLVPECAHGTFVAPIAFEIKSLKELQREVFGPVLHLISFDGEDLDRVCADINATGYGLTLGLHTRIESVMKHVRSLCKAGNIYVNRNQIGAVVEAQPFGGEGLSGTGPKAGGPHYLLRFVTERVCSTDTTAAGGNAALLSGMQT